MPENEVVENELIQESPNSGNTPSVPAETFEVVGVSESLFVARMDSLENLLFVNFVCCALLVGCLLASLVMRWFHVR